MLDFGVFLESKPILYTLIFVGISFAFLWLLSVYWVYRDIFNRTKNTGLQIASIVIAVLFPFVGVVMYTLLRPSLTLEEAKLQLMDEKIMLRQIGGRLFCPHCHKAVDDEYLYCPYCHIKIKESCPRCDKAVDRKFSICPFCGYKIKDKRSSEDKEVTAKSEPEAKQSKKE